MTTTGTAAPQTAEVLTTAEFHAAVLALSPAIAVFDCDGTLWSGDAGSGFMRWTIEQKLLSPEAIAWLDTRYRGYLAGQVSEVDICGHMVQVYRGLRDSEMRAAAAEFFTSEIEPRIFPEMLALIADLQARNVDIWAVSSTNDWAIEEGVRRFNIPPSRVLAARVAVAGGLVTDTLLDVPTDEGKVAALARAGISAPDAVFGNSIHDAAMLSIARGSKGTSGAFPVNPAPPLLSLSNARRWPVYYPTSVAPPQRPTCFRSPAHPPRAPRIAMLLEGLHIPLTTPFHADGRLNLPKLAANVARYSKTLAAGLIVLGPSGEPTLLSDNETRDVLHTAAQAAAPEKVLLAGIARDSVHSVLSLAAFAAEQHYDAILVAVPSFLALEQPYVTASTMEMPRLVKLRLREQRTFFQTIADRSPLPVVLLSVNGRFIRIPDSVELASHSNIIGIVDIGKLAEIHQARIKGHLERIATIRREATVTSTFAAVTARMKLAAAATPAPALVSASSLTGSATAIAEPPHLGARPAHAHQIRRLPDSQR